MEINAYLNPVSAEVHAEIDYKTNPYCLGSHLQKTVKSITIDDADVVLLGVENEQGGAVPDSIRKELYQLSRISENLKIIDLGNLRAGKTALDTHVAMADVCSYLLEKKCLLIFLGGDKDIDYPMAKSFEGQFFNMVYVDNKLSLHSMTNEMTDANVPYHILKDFKNLSALSFVATQNYFIDDKEQDEAQFQDISVLRLGEYRSNANLVEPLLRSANFMSFNVESIRGVDFPAQKDFQPNGLRAEEACQLVRYWGVGSFPQIFALHNMCPEFDNRKQSAKLAAQIVWHVVEGYNSGIMEYPADYAGNFKQYIVQFPELEEEMVFVESLITKRWWIKFYNSLTDEDEYIPCLEKDFLDAKNLDLPEVWLKLVKKTRI